MTGSNGFAPNTGGYKPVSNSDPPWGRISSRSYRACPKSSFLANFTTLETVIDFIKQIFRQNRHFSDRLYSRQYKSTGKVIHTLSESPMIVVIGDMCETNRNRPDIRPQNHTVRIGSLLRGELSDGMNDTNHTFHGSEEQLVSIIEALDTSNVGTFVLDSDFSVVWVNQAIEAFFDTSPEALIGKDKPSMVEAELKHRFERPDQFAERVQTAYQENTQQEEFECHILPSETREERWLIHRSKPIEDGQYAGGRVEQYTDITDRKQYASARETSQKKFRTIFEYANDAIFIVDVENDSVVDCNPAAEELVGYSREELQSMPASDLHPHNLSEFKQFADQVLEEGHGWTDDITCYGKSGDIIPAEMSAAVVEIDGRPHLVTGHWPVARGASSLAVKAQTVGRVPVRVGKVGRVGTGFRPPLERRA